MIDEALRPQACGSFVVVRTLNNFKKYLSMEERARHLNCLVPLITSIGDQSKQDEQLRVQNIKHWLNEAYSICNKFVHRRTVNALKMTTEDLHAKAGKLTLHFNATIKKLTDKEKDHYDRFSKSIIRLIMTQSGIRTVCDTQSKFHFFVIETLCLDAIRHMILKTMLEGRTQDFDVWGKIETDAQVLRTKLQESFLHTVKKLVS